MTNNYDLVAQNTESTVVREYTPDYGKRAKNYQSEADLEKEFGVNINHFCYPYGDHNDDIVSTIKRAGYQTATTVNRGRVRMNDNLLTLHRVPITHHTLPHLFLLKVLGNYEDKHR
jgi:peptidoglycan/xylan/chitin deacetylase (PgdA/CDA1 family)